MSSSSVAELVRLYDYSCWANRLLLSVSARLSAEQFTRNVAGSYGSVRTTFVHVLSAEWGWLERCGGLHRGDRLQPEQFATLDQLVEAWSRVEAHMRAFLDGLGDDDLQFTIEFALGPGPRQSRPMGDILLHALIHAAHHRGQVALLLRELGLVPGNVDFLIYNNTSSTQGSLSA